MQYLKKSLLLLLIPILFLGVLNVGDFFDMPSFQDNFVGEKNPSTSAPEDVISLNAEKEKVVTVELAQNTDKNKYELPATKMILANNVEFVAPMDQAEKRITKKTFGMYITPETSPVQPDKFRGFHAGADWEVFSDEINKDVSVQAVCSGPLRMKKTASGYGGVAVQQCELEGESITIIYGHMKLSSMEARVGDVVSAGEVIGFLGDDKSVETDGARKHLHLAFHRGSIIDIKGYLKTKKELDNWIDPCLYVCR